LGDLFSQIVHPCDRFRQIARLEMRWEEALVPLEQAPPPACAFLQRLNQSIAEVPLEELPSLL
jgi:hypothetical protein